jgi:hypothetical protein
MVLRSAIRFSAGEITRVFSNCPQKRSFGFPMKTRKKMTRKSMDPIMTLLRNRDKGLMINEPQCPLLVRAIRKASHKVIKGVKGAEMENTGEEYPLYALRVALEGALSQVSVMAY